MFPETLDELIAPDAMVRVVDAFVGTMDLAALGFAKAKPARTGRPSYAPGDLLKLYLYGYLHHQHAVIYDRLARLMAELFGLRISEGAIANALRRANRPLEGAGTAIGGAVAPSGRHRLRRKGVSGISCSAGLS